MHRATGIWRRRFGLAAMAGAIGLMVAGASAASTTHYFYDGAGRYVGSTSEPNAIRSNRYDGADNRTLWQSLLASAKNSTWQIANYQVLFQGQALVSGNGSYTLAMQEDGNAVVYSGSTAIWSTGTYLTSGASLDMQGDGNLVLFDAQWNAIWSTCTSGNPGATLVMQSDGNLVIYTTANKAIWASQSSPSGRQC